MAEVTPRGVRLTWRTTAEIDNVGFRILRGREGEEPVVITPQIIPAKGTELSGAEYEYLDTDRLRPGTVKYQLEDIDLYGLVTRHAPELVEIGRSRPSRARTDAWRRSRGR